MDRLGDQEDVLLLNPVLIVILEKVETFKTRSSSFLTVVCMVLYLSSIETPPSEYRRN